MNFELYTGPTMNNQFQETQHYDTDAANYKSSRPTLQLNLDVVSAKKTFDNYEELPDAIATYKLKERYSKLTDG